jgi:hypothetical protein
MDKIKEVKLLSPGKEISSTPSSSVRENTFLPMPKPEIKGAPWGTGVNQLSLFCWLFLQNERDADTEGELIIKALSTASSVVDQICALHHVERRKVINTFILDLRRRLSGGGF